MRELLSIADLDAVLADTQAPVVLFKHSTI